MGIFKSKKNYTNINLQLNDMKNVFFSCSNFIRYDEQNEFCEESINNYKYILVFKKIHLPF